MMTRRNGMDMTEEERKSWREYLLRKSRTSGSPPIGKLDWDACLMCQNYEKSFGCTIPPNEMDDAFEVDAFNDSVHCAYFLANA